jgi:hypothetical protein
MEITKAEYTTSCKLVKGDAKAEVHFGKDGLRLTMERFYIEDRKGASRTCKGLDSSVQYPLGADAKRKRLPFKLMVYLEASGKVSGRVHTDGNKPMPTEVVEKFLQVNLDGNQATILHPEWMSVTATFRKKAKSTGPIGSGKVEAQPVETVA